MASVKDENGKAHRKPAFGPPMTPEIFDAKWGAKFESIKARYGLLYATPADEADAVAFLERAIRQIQVLIPHIQACQQEGEALGLRLPEVEQLNKQPSLIVCGLFVALAHQLGIEVYIETFRDMKNGKPGVARWIDLPLRLRRDINKILVEIQAEKEKGFWTIDQKARDLNSWVQRWMQPRMEGRNASGGVQHLKTAN